MGVNKFLCGLARGSKLGAIDTEQPRRDPLPVLMWSPRSNAVDA